MARRKRVRKSKSSPRVYCVLLVVLFGCLFLAKNVLLKSTVCFIGSNVLGVKVHIDDLKLQIRNQRILIKGLQIRQPKGYPEDIFVDAPKIEAQTKLWPLLSGQARFPLLSMTVSELVLIRDRSGRLNTDVLKIAQRSPDTISTPSERDSNRFQIDLLKLNVRRVVYKDYSVGPEPRVRVYDVALKNKTFRNIAGLKKLSALVIVQAMGPTAIKGAGIYAAASLMGVGFLPAGIVGVMVGKDDSAAIVKYSIEDVYLSCLNFVRLKGKLTTLRRDQGMLKGNIDGYSLKFQLKVVNKDRTHIRVTARKALLPKPSVAAGFLYQLEKYIAVGD